MEAFLSTRRARAVVFALPLALAAVSLRIGFVTDDHAFRAMLHSPSRHAPAPWDLFRFQGGTAAETEARIRFGHLPWWAAPDLKIHFLRPVTSLLFALDDRLFGEQAIGYHATSLLWLALMLAGVSILYRRILPGAAATLGLCAFGLAAAHTQAWAWPSARHALVGGTGAAWALALYSRGGRTRWLGLAPLALGLAASETALGAVPLWCALAWGSRARAPHPRGRLFECLPALALGLAYLAAYVALGGGTRASDGYHDPLTDPFGFAALAVVRVPILLGDAALGIPAELALIVRPGVIALLGIGAVALVGLAWRATGAARQLGWLALGGLAALLPSVAGYPVGRALVVPDLAFAALIGAIVERGISAPIAGKTLASALAVAHFVVAPLLALHDVRALAQRGRTSERVAHEARDLVPAGARAILIAASDPLVFLYPRAVLADTAPGAISCWSVLSAARSTHRLTRAGDRLLVLEAVDRPLLAGSFDTLFRASNRPFAVGDTADQCGATIRVSALRDGLPIRLEIDFQRRLDDPKLTFLVLRDRHLERLAMPAIGETILLDGATKNQPPQQ